MLCLVPAVSLAADPADYIMDFCVTDATWGGLGGVNLTLDDASGTGWTWKAASETLTLTNFSFVTTKSVALKVPANTTVVLVGRNTIETQIITFAQDAYAILSLGALHIQGNGSLTVTGSKILNSSYDSIGIASNGAVVISGGATVAANGGNTDTGRSCGVKITGAGASLAVSNATLNATGSVSNSGSYGIAMYEGSFTVLDGGTVNATGGAAEAAVIEQGSATAGAYSARLYTMSTADRRRAGAVHHPVGCWRRAAGAGAYKAQSIRRG